ncbi:uncharacterized protein G2W53_028403 [Senna tora]|uniref:RNase H type-1 domain-containing protein n=1 Tax=Senna tora TaxID=362788 RepID=A0A834T299_9FABA|nr:uncharacterized protein G2W53_028403 [Senna tora]
MSLYKSIGDGKATMVWKDSWIPGVKRGELVPVNEEAKIITSVSDLLYADGRAWNKQVLDTCFDRITVEKILCIPLNKTHLLDRQARECFPFVVRMSGGAKRLGNGEIQVLKLAIRSSGEGALGGVFRDSGGVVHGAFMALAPALNDSTLVEALAIKKGVEVARQMGVTDLVVESDSRLVIDMLNSNCNDSSLLCSICVSILDICLDFNDVFFKWIPRACNMCADKICKAARHVAGEQIWQDSLPFCITDICTEEFL